MDFTTYLGPSVSSINVSKKRNKNDKANMNTGKVIISGCSNKKMNEPQTILNKNSTIQWKPVSEPLMDLNDHVLRTYVALTLGCDAYIKGFAGLGPAKVSNILRDVNAPCEKEDKNNEEKR